MVDFRGEYTIAGEASLKPNVALTTSINSGKFKIASGIPGVSQKGSGDGLGDIKA